MASGDAASGVVLSSLSSEPEVSPSVEYGYVGRTPDMDPGEDVEEGGEGPPTSAVTGISAR